MFKKILLNIIRPQGIFAKAMIAVGVFAILVLAEMGYLDGIIGFMKSDGINFKIGDFSFSLYKIAKAIIILIVLLWFASVFSDIFVRKINQLSINPSNRNLINKAFQIALYCFIFIFSLNAVGIDLTALTILSGAIGIGIGFGLQKIASNFISGLILLFEKSIEEGDLIELDDSICGTVKKTNARYTLVETFDSREVFIPNEDLITTRVTNWTYSNHVGRISIDIGVSYNSDLDLTMKLILEAARENALVSKERLPECYLKEFADSSVNFILIFWVDDILKGRQVPRSQVMHSIWNKFKQNNIEIPFPQRDLHIKTDQTKNPPSLL